jgi:uncharacterized membrane protein YfcA
MDFILKRGIMELDFLLMLGLIMCFASFVQGSIGFGFPMIATAFLSLFMDIQTAIFFTLIPALFLNVVSITSEGNFFRAVRDFYPFALFSILGSAVGTWVILSLDSQIFKLLLAGIIFFYLFANRLNLHFKVLQAQPKASLVGFGVVTGLVGGLTNVMAPLFLIYSLEAKLSQSQMIQAGNVSFLSAKIVQIALFSLSGKIMNVEFTFSFSILLAVALFFYLGTKVKRKMNSELYRKAIKVLLFLIASGLIIQWAI